ncbi:MAG: gas vesicle protein GvpD P-loop domain-containing protein [Candidatus Syntropharchaeia archaeon]
MWKGYSLLVRGAPGSGKTTFALELLRRYKERGIYFSTRSNRDALYDQFPWLKEVVYKIDFTLPPDVIKMVEDQVFEYSNRLEFIKAIYDRVEGIETPAMIVIDSWEAISEQIGESGTGIEMELLNAIRGLKANLILVTERDAQTSLDYLVDAIVVLNKSEIDGRCIREIQISKVRGIKKKEEKYLFTLDGGRFNAFQPFKRIHPTKKEKFRPIRDIGNNFSTGNRYLDEIFGGYPRHGRILIEIGKNVDINAVSVIYRLCIVNFLAQNRAVSVIPIGKENEDNVEHDAILYGVEDALKNRFKIALRNNPFKPASKHFVFSYDVDKLKKMINEWNAELLKLKVETNNEPMLRLIGCSTLESLFEERALYRTINYEAERISGSDDLGIFVGKHSTSFANEKLADISDMHIKIEERDGCFILYGIKPRTGIYHMEIDLSKGYPDMVLTPML